MARSYKAAAIAYGALLLGREGGAETAAKGAEA